MPKRPRKKLRLRDILDLQRPRRLWEQYLGKTKAELNRGNGWWSPQSQPCRLEPPWDEFTLREVNQWDCQFHGWQASYWTSLLAEARALRPLFPNRRRRLLPDLFSESLENLAVIDVRQFLDDDTTPALAEQLLYSLLAIDHPVAFEVIGTGALPLLDPDNDERITGWTEPRVVTQFVTSPTDTALLLQQLTESYPNSAIVSDQTPPTDLQTLVDLHADPDRVCGASLALETTYAMPLRLLSRFAPDPLSVPLAVLDNLGRHDWAVLQVLFEPTRNPWADTLWDATANPYEGGASYLNDTDLRQLKSKLSSPLCAVSIRLLASRPAILKPLLAWPQQFANPPHQHLQVHPDDSQQMLLSVVHRVTYRPGMLLNITELAGLVHLPTTAITAERLCRTTSRTRPALPATEQAGSVRLGENIHRGQRRDARIPATIRPHHCYIAGATGTGKSTLLLNCVLQDIRAGAGVGVLDPHGDLIADLLARMPEDRLADVVYFNAADTDYPVGLNILQATDAAERERVVSETVAALHRYFPDSWGPRLEHILTHTLHTVVRLKGGTLLELRRMLTDASFRSAVVSKLTNADLVSFWNNEFPHLPTNAVDPILNKLSPFLLSSTVKNIICQRQTRLNFDHIINHRRIFLANLSFGLLTEQVAGVLGMFVVNKILSATFRRAAIPREQRTPFYLYIDEFQNFLNLSRGFDRILSEARKFGLVLTMANQYVAQLTPAVRAAVFGNVGTLLTFRLGVDDAHLIAKDFGVFTAEEILQLQVGQAIARVGSSENSYNLTTFREPPRRTSDPTGRIIAMNRQRYAASRQHVEATTTPKHQPARIVAPPATSPQPVSRTLDLPKQRPRDGTLEDFVS